MERKYMNSDNVQIKRARINNLVKWERVTNTQSKQARVLRYKS